MKLQTLLLITFLLLPLFACKSQASVSIPPTSTTIRVVQDSTIPASERTLQPIQAVATEETQEIVPPTATERVCPPSAGSPSITHTANVNIFFTQNAADVTQVTRYLNLTGEILEQIIFDVEANRVPAAFTLNSLRVDGEEAPAYELTGRQMTISLPQPLPPGCSIEIEMIFRLVLPVIGEGAAGIGGYFGHSQRQLNFGNALPFLATRQNGDWVIHPVSAIGEQIVADPANWDVRLVIEGAPDNLIVAAPGTIEQHDAGEIHILFENSRDFAFSLNTGASLASQVTANGVTVEMVTFEDAIVPGENGPIRGPAHALEAAARAVEMYSDLFGQYPYDRLVVVQGDFPDGMEYTGLVFVGGDWFRTYPGTPASYLFLITVHEVAHQWWYASVGNDQAFNPFLDEALATYSEVIFLEEFYPDLRDWWWDFRVGTFVPPDYNGLPVNSSVYQFDSIRPYINAVYLNGANMFEALRQALGTDAFFNWLRRYAEASARRIATPDQFWALLTPAQQEIAAETRARFTGQ